MKKIAIKAMILFMAGTMTMSSCIGSFGLFNKLLSWNKGISNKFVNEVVFFILTPVYGITYFIDAVVLNSVEFWTGENPIAKVGTTENIWGKDGKMYAVKTMKNGYEITKPTGEKVNFLFDKEQKIWSMEAEGQETQLFRFNEDGTIEAFLPNGDTQNVALTEEGVNAFRMQMNGGLFFAAR
ncbi:MAG: DUF3332 domain-containing protein [Prevotella sp.]|nr:DUF3332 domain-containing protein [Prevotella sp.]MBR2017180.1 DUF3332 domain-containing protein [Prevotella sp.]MBR2035998.1 DUF3332 domain-containing protein [Prevotella sp.]MBR2882860.1 DUF3332 domain-containing protein [Prevotella sp.]MBR6592497.1 DUF3332 domain-containing protein [Prevotella sp.]